MAVLRQTYEFYGKGSHREALEAAGRLKAVLDRGDRPAIKTQVFEADAFDASPLDPTIMPGEVALVLSDLPYGQGSQLAIPGLEMGMALSDAQLATRLLTALEPALRANAVICLLAPETVKISHSRFRVVRRVQAGKRVGIILQRSN